MSSLDFEILERPDFSILRVRMAQGQQIFAEPSVMASMDDSLELRAGLKGGLLGSVGRAIAGESMVLNTFTAERGPGELMLAPGAPGDVVHHRVRGASLLLQRGAYIAHTEGIEINAKWGGARGFFSGQGLVLLKASGTGDVFFSTYGGMLELDVTDGFIVDTGYIAAFEDTLHYEITVLPGLSVGSKVKSFFFGGEGLVARFSGQGKVWVQTRTINPFLSWVYPYRPVKKQD